MPDATAAIIATAAEPVPTRYFAADSRRLAMYSSGYSVRNRMFGSISLPPAWAFHMPIAPDFINIDPEIRKVKAQLKKIKERLV